MKPIGTKQLVASTLVFLFTSFTIPAMGTEAPAAQAKAVSTQQKSVTTQQTPRVDVGIPRVVNLAAPGTQQSVQKGDKVIIRSVDFSHTLMNDLKKCSFSFDEKKVTVSISGYGDQAG
ncbi:MAG TPA: hypothetical protein VN457_02110, partial [Chlamydiales bacterium]|nr:hypothetical protein [Chlamydiales bacterium]